MSNYVANLLIGLVLAECVDGPDSGGHPTEKSDLQDETQHACKWPTDGEERQPGKEESD
jgi:hypothetical protein